MKDNLAMAQDVLFEKINRICGKFGLNSMMAQIYTILYLSNKALSLDDMVEQLKISKGSASINIRALERYGAVKRAWIRGSRKDYYEAESDISKVITERIRAMARNTLTEIDDMVGSSFRALESFSPHGEEEKEALRVFKERLEKLRYLYEKAQSLFDLFNTSLLNTELTEKADLPA